MFACVSTFLSHEISILNPTFHHDAKSCPPFLFIALPFFLFPPLQKKKKDRDGNVRVTGEEWLVKKVGAYLPGAYEEVVDTVDAYVLTDKVSIREVDTHTHTHTHTHVEE